MPTRASRTPREAISRRRLDAGLTRILLVLLAATGRPIARVRWLRLPKITECSAITGIRCRGGGAPWRALKPWDVKPRNVRFENWAAAKSRRARFRLFLIRRPPHR